MKAGVKCAHPHNLVLTGKRHHLIATQVGRIHRIEPLELRGTWRQPVKTVLSAHPQIAGTVLVHCIDVIV